MDFPPTHMPLITTDEKQAEMQHKKRKNSNKRIFRAPLSAGKQRCALELLTCTIKLLQCFITCQTEAFVSANPTLTNTLCWPQEEPQHPAKREGDPKSASTLLRNNAKQIYRLCTESSVGAHDTVWSTDSEAPLTGDAQGGFARAENL